MTRSFSRAAVVVIILKVEPGGWGAEKAWPASARTSPLRASRTAIPPERPASAETADSCRPVSIVVFTGAPGLRLALGDRCAPSRSSSETASSEPPGLPASRALKACSRPLTPTGVSAEKPCRAQRRQVFFFGGSDFAGDVDRGAAERVFAGVGVAFGQRACRRRRGSAPAGPVRSRSRGARPRRRPGKTRLGSQAMPPSS